MAFANAQKSRALVGSLHYSGYLKQISGFGFNVTALDTTSLVDTAKTFITGQDTSDASFDIMLDTDSTAGGLVANLQAWKGNGSPIMFGPTGVGVGDSVFLTQSLMGQLTVTTSPDALVMASLSAQTDGPSDVGTVLESLTAVTVDGNGTARDGGAASSNGGIAQLHITAFSGLTSDVVTIEHSVDGSTSWATLVTFSTVTGLTSERVVVPAATTVRRYLRVVDDVTGTGSVTRTVAFSRR